MALPDQTKPIAPGLDMPGAGGPMFGGSMMKGLLGFDPKSMGIQSTGLPGVSSLGKASAINMDSKLPGFMTSKASGKGK
jgi:hypothetical protein